MYVLYPEIISEADLGQLQHPWNFFKKENVL